MPGFLQRLESLAAVATGPCAGCGARRQSPLCPRCLTQSAMAESPYPVPSDWGAVYVLGDYYAARPDGWRTLSPLGRCLRAFKDRGDRYAGRCLARLFADRFQPLVDPGDVIVPIPPDPRRLRQRLFHPAGWLAGALGRRSRVPVRRDALRRRSGRPAQRGLGGVARRANAREAFQLGPRAHEGYGILLADDVLTTGATLEAAARCLADSGAANVRGIALACADEEVFRRCRSTTGSDGNDDTRVRRT